MLEVVKNVAEAGKTFDYIVCCHKAINQDAVPEQLAAGVDENKTTLVIIQNGVGNEEPFRKAFPKAVVLSCVVSEALSRSCCISHCLTYLDMGWREAALTWCCDAH